MKSKEIKRVLNAGNFFCYSVETLLFSRLLSENTEIEIYWPATSHVAVLQLRQSVRYIKVRLA